MAVKVPRFQVDRTLGSGSTGEVLHGELLEDFGGFAAGSEIAVKYLHASLTEEKRATLAFEREAETALTVRDPGLVRAIATGKDERGPFIIMEFVPGQTLREVLSERGPLPEPTLRSVATQVAGGLVALHEKGYVHGDVKPENIRLGADGRAVLVDLGFARRAGATDAPPPSSSPALADGSGSRAAGTLLYLAPERIRGEEGRASSDVFALGVVLYELATGVHPFAGDAPLSAESSRPSSRRVRPVSDVQAVVERLLEEEAEPASALEPMLSPFLDALLGACLERAREARPTAPILLDALTNAEASDWWRQRVDFETGAREAGRDRQHFTPLVGRTEDLETLRALAEAGLDTEGQAGAQVLWLEGELGAGKTRLARELVARLRSRKEPPLFLYGRSWATRENAPCQPLLRMLQRYLGLPRNGAPGDREFEHLSALVPPSEVETLMRALNPHGTEATPVSVPAALANWLVALAERHPVLLFLDDVHYADAETLRSLWLAAETLGDSRLFAVFACGTGQEARHQARLSNLHERLEDTVELHVHSLTSLCEVDVQELVRKMFDSQSPVLRLGTELWKQSQGHPGFLTELLRGMVSRGDMVESKQESDRYALTVAPSRLPRPENFERAVLDSFRALEEGDRAWLQRLSVVGRKIEPDFLLRSFEHTSIAEIDEVLARLVRTSWLTPHARRFRFSRPASREIIYKTISAGRRRRLHAGAAAALRPESGTPITISDAFQRAYHLRASEQFEELLGVLRPLLKRLQARGMPQRVWRLSTWGLDAIEALGSEMRHRELHLELLEGAANAADSLGRRTQQRALLDRLAESEAALSKGETKSVQLGRVYLLHGRYAASTGQNGLARGWFRNAANLFEEANDESLWSESLRRLSLVQAVVGDLDAAEDLARESLALAPDRSAERGYARLALATTYLLNDRLESALSETGRAVYRLRRVENANVSDALTQAQILRARIYRSLGRPLRALGAANRSLQLARTCGQRRLEAEAGARLGGLLLHVNRVDEAEARLRDSLLLASEVEDKTEQALASLFLGVLLAEADRSEAGTRLRAATRLARDTATPRVEALSLSIEARLDLQYARIERAQTGTRRARFLLNRYGAELFDRVVIEGTAALVSREAGSDESRHLEKELQRRLRRESARIESDRLRRRHRAASGRLLEAVLAKDGPLYPRLKGFEKPADRV